MIIIIDDYGTDIERENASFLISKGDAKRQISPHRITAFHLKKPCTISSPALLLAAEFQIPVLLFNSTGRVKARVWQPFFGSHAKIRHQQMAYARTSAGLLWVAQGIALKVDGQLGLLRWVSNRLPSQYALLQDAIAKIATWRARLDHAPDDAETLRSAEAQAARIYWEAMFAALAEYEPADKRSRRPAKDPLNALLNYGYGMLYGEVETAALTAGLDPHIGIMHREEFGKPAFVFDAIEPFRPWVDRLVVDLAIGSQIKSTWFEEKGATLGAREQGQEASREALLPIQQDLPLAPKPLPLNATKPLPLFWLSKEGKKAFIPAYFKMLHERTEFQQRRIKRKDQIQLRLTNLAQYLFKDYQHASPRRDQDEAGQNRLPPSPLPLAPNP